MKASKMMLSYLLATLLFCCLIPGVAFSDGPWDIDNGGGSEINGGGAVHDRDAVSSRSGFVPGGYGTGDDGPSLVTAITYNWLYQAGFVKLANSILIKDVERRVEKRRGISKSRR